MTGRHDVPGGGPEVLASGLGAVLNPTRASQSFARVFLVSQNAKTRAQTGWEASMNGEALSMDLRERVVERVLREEVFARLPLP